jgi:hypothetical protein
MFTTSLRIICYDGEFLRKVSREAKTAVARFGYFYKGQIGLSLRIAIAANGNSTGSGKLNNNFFYSTAIEGPFSLAASST